MGKRKVILLFFSLLFIIGAYGNADSQVEIHVPKIVVQNIPVHLKLVHLKADTSFSYIVIIGSDTITVPIINGVGSATYSFSKNTEIRISSTELSRRVKPIPLWLSVLPPLIAIVLALVFREVVTSLFLGIFMGTALIESYASNNIFLGLGKGLLSIIDDYIISALLDKGHLSIIVFSMMIGAMVNIITRNGGMKGVVNMLSRFANTRQSGQFATWLLGVSIFFDDYANTLVVGNTMRPITDKLKISRQKLAYLVDSTAAPIAAIAFVTTWIGAELSYIQSGIDTLGLSLSPYNVFLNSLAYSFYPIFTLVFILFLIRRNVDFGPMLKYEREAVKHGIKEMETQHGFSNHLNELELDKNINAKWFNAAIPVLIVIIGTFIGLLYTGWDDAIVDDFSLSFSQKLSSIIGASDSYKSLLWSSLFSTIAAVFLSLGQKILSLQESIDSIINGFRTMLTAIIILVLAWSIALITEHLHTADFISKLIIETEISPIFVPLITFILAALVAFSTGSSWGTMAILYPLILPAAWLITKEYNYSYNESLNIFYNVVASVLAGSVLGDHCSPISDTTILSSLASSCPHIEHVKTQLPYALTVGVVAALFGVLPASFGVAAYITFPIGLLVLYLVIRLFGKKI